MPTAEILKQSRWRWMSELVRSAAAGSDDPDRQVGCVVAREESILAVTCNRMASGVRRLPERLRRPAKYEWIEHAERCAVFDSAKNGVRLAGATMYLEWFPCADCARAIAMSGIAALVAGRPDEPGSRWHGSHQIAGAILRESGVLISDWGPGGVFP